MNNTTKKILLFLITLFFLNNSTMNRTVTSYRLSPFEVRLLKKNISFQTIEKVKKQRKDAIPYLVVENIFDRKKQDNLTQKVVRKSDDALDKKYSVSIQQEMNNCCHKLKIDRNTYVTITLENPEELKVVTHIYDRVKLDNIIKDKEQKN